MIFRTLPLLLALAFTLAAQPASARGLGNDLRAAALMNLGIAELWASRAEDACRHLEQALELARRIGRPYLELGCLGHLAIAAPLLGWSASVSLVLCEQAVALARSLLDDRPIMLLDEPTASMDVGSEEQFKARLTAVLPGRTLIVVTHRESMLTLVDKLIVMDNGRAVAAGPKAEVLQALSQGRVRKAAG